MRRFSLTFTLILAFALLAAISLWTAFQVSGRALQATVEAQERDEMRTIGRVLEELVAEHSLRARLTARLTAGRDSLATTLADAQGKGAATLAAVVESARVASEIDLIEVTDNREAVVYRSQESERPGDRSSSWGVFEALEGASLMVSDLDGGALTLRAIEPIRVQDRIVGTVSAGVRVDAALLERLSRELGAELFLVSRNGEPLAASTSTARTLDRILIQEALTQKIPVYHQSPAAHETVGYLPLTIIDNAYVMVAVLDSAAAYQRLEDANRRAAEYAAAILVVSSGLGMLLLRWVLRPLRALRRKAEGLATAMTGSGIAANTGNEVQSVVNVLETLTDRLVARNSELVEARQTAEAASRAKSQFLSNMSHEIRTPLNGILGMAEVLARTPLNEQQSRYLHAITSAGRALHELLGDILDLAKIEAGKITLERIDFELQTLLAQFTEVFRELASVRGNTLLTDFRIPASLPLQGDPTRLRQVLSNLVTNAIKFTEGGTITLAAGRLDPPPGDARVWLRFTVRDTGIGIAPEAISGLFQPFVQADQSTTRRFGGSGLGLVISKHLVDLMGGTIRVDSVFGGGSVFAIDLPFAEAASPPAEESAERCRLHRIAARILVAEDNPVSQAVIEAMLGQIGATPTIVENGALAVEALSKDSFDLVLMDCQMPVMDGYQATATIRALPTAASRVPILALTANALPEDRQRCLNAGMDDYLSKPLRLDSLLAGLLRWLPVSDGPPGASPREPAVAAAAAPVLAPSRAVLDRSALLDNTSFNRSSSGDLVRRVLGLYLDDAPKLLAGIRSRLPEQAWPELARAAHSLKSSSAAVGLTAVASGAASIEALARREDGPGIEVTLAALDTDFELGVAALRAELEHRAGTQSPGSRETE
jgi:signal transduction histidine kinase/HPt (histidine-containing phosphotransfer) domain-containing protein/FixJ family two-component response regulator